MALLNYYKQFNAFDWNLATKVTWCVIVHGSLQNWSVRKFVYNTTHQATHIITNLQKTIVEW